MNTNEDLRSHVETPENMIAQILAEHELSRNQMQEGRNGAEIRSFLHSSDQRPDGDENRYWEERFRRLMAQHQVLESTLEQTNDILQAKEMEIEEMKRKLQDAESEKARLESQALNLNQKNEDLMQQIDLLRDVERELNSHY